MNKLNKKNFLIIALMLFSMFFGAGNFIFPPMLGRSSGAIFYETIFYFCLTAIILPVLGVAAVAKNGTINNLTGKVDKFFGPIFILLTYLAIGPFLAIPRASTLPFEVINISSILKNQHLALFVWSVLFFIINYIVSLNKSKIVDIIGKWLTPILLTLIFTLVVGVLIIGNDYRLVSPIGKYAIAPNSTAFLEGYNTMDAMASTVFAVIVINAIKNLGITNSKKLATTTIKVGIIAGILLAIIYVSLAYLGATTATIIGEASNGIEILTKTSFVLFGKSGQIILGMALFLACLTTTVGLTVSGSEHFYSIVPKISYKVWCLIFSIISLLMANLGLNGFLKYGIPVITAFYPVVIVLVLLGLLDNLIDSSKLVYRCCIYVTLVLGLLYSLGTINGFLPTSLLDLARKIMPFYDYGLGWVLWTIITFCITFVIHIIYTNKKI